MGRKTSDCYPEAKSSVQSRCWSLVRGEQAIIPTKGAKYKVNPRVLTSRSRCSRPPDQARFAPALLRVTGNGCDLVEIVTLETQASEDARGLPSRTLAEKRADYQARSIRPCFASPDQQPHLAGSVSVHTGRPLPA